MRAMRSLACSAALALIVCMAHAPASVLAQDARDEPVQLNLVDTDIGGVLRMAARFTGRQFLVDPRVTGKMTVVSDGPVSRTQAYQLLLGALRMRGFAVVENGGVSRVVPQADAKLLGGRVGTGGAGGEVATRTFALRYENAAALVAVLRPMISPDNPITANPGNNTLVITDYADNLERIARVIASVDTPAGMDTDVVKLQQGIAVDVAAMVAPLLDAQQQRAAAFQQSRSYPPGAAAGGEAGPRAGRVRQPACGLPAQCPGQPAGRCAAWRGGRAERCSSDG
jgi:general secretion pathway protein D